MTEFMDWYGCYSCGSTSLKTIKNPNPSTYRVLCYQCGNDWIEDDPRRIEKFIVGGKQ